MRFEDDEIDFDFDYTGSNLTGNEAVKKRYSLLSGKELLSQTSNKTVSIQPTTFCSG